MNLLYPTPLTSETDESFRRDSHAKASLDALGIGELVSMDSNDLLRLLTSDPSVIAYRQAELDDMEKISGLTDVLTKLREYLGTLRELSRKRTALGSSTEDILYSFGEVSTFIEMIDSLCTDIDTLPSPSSDGFAELFGTLRRMASDENFSLARETVEKMEKSIKYARSVTIGVNLNPSFGVYEAGVVSINSDYYTNSGFFATVFGRKPKKDEGDLKVFAPLVSPEASPGFENAIYNVLNSAVSKSFAKARSILLTYIRETVSELYPIYDDLTFLLRTSEALSEMKAKFLKTTLPIIGGTWKAEKLANPALLKKMKGFDITASDILPHEDVSLRVITGPNAGGKSVFLRAVGTAVFMTCLGLGVAAESFTMPKITSVFCHFPAKDSLDDSRLVEECKAMREIIDELDENSLLLMDETFSGTNSAEGAVIAGEVIGILQEKRSHVFFSTHLHDISDRIDEFNRFTPKVLPLSAEYADGKRTYRIVEGVSDRSSYALEIARRFGLESPKHR